MLKKIGLAASAAALIAAPIALQAQVSERAPVSDEQEMGGGTLLGVLGAIAGITLGIILLDGDDKPVSP